MRDQETAYWTADPTIVDAYKTARAAQTAYTDRLVADTKALGGNAGPYARWDTWFGGLSMTGLRPGDGEPPAGWRYLKTYDRIEPMRGKPGAGARAWLSDHQMPAEANVRAVMAAHGLPIHVQGAMDDGIGLYLPSIALYGDRLWATCSVEMTECTWNRGRLSEYYAAKEAAEEREAGGDGE